MQDEVEMLKPEGLIQFALYTDINRKSAIPLMDVFWADFKTLFSSYYQYGTRHSLTIPADGETIEYIVAMMPVIRHVPSPRDATQTVCKLIVYFVRAEVFPLLDDLRADEVDTSMFPDIS